MPVSIGYALAIVLTIGFYALLARLFLRRADADRAEDWALFNAVVLTDETEPVVERYLPNRYWLRRVGAISGAVIAPSVTAAFGIDVAVNGMVWVLLGYLAGVVVAELTLARVPGNGGRVASLVTRRLGTYLPRLLIVVQVLLPAVAVALSIVTVLATPVDVAAGVPMSGPTFHSGADQRAGAVLAGPIALGTAVLVMVGQRYLVRRPQPIGSVEVVAVDDAMRISAVRLIGATGATIAALAISAQALYLANALDPGRIGGNIFMWVGIGVAPALALACWFGRLPRGYRLRAPGTLPVVAGGEGHR